MSVDKRAAFAYECAKEVKEKNIEPKEYKAYCKKLPMMIKTNGLGATLAFVRTKANGKESSRGVKAYSAIEAHFHKWLKESHLSEALIGKPVDMAGEVVQLDSPTYRAVTIELLALLSWMRRFAEGLIEGEA